MTIRGGEKFHMVERRRFDSDVRRHFVGVVEDVSEGTVRARGFAFVFDTGSGGFVKKNEWRTRIISLLDADNVINVLPDSFEPEHARYTLDSDRRLVLTDGKDLQLDIHEFGPRR
jgi:hypothetical protein